MGYFSTLFYNVLTSLLSQSIDKKYSGSLLSLEMGIGSALGIICPSIGGLIL